MKVPPRHSYRCLGLVIAATFSFGFLDGKPGCKSDLCRGRQFAEVRDNNTLLLEYSLGHEDIFLSAHNRTSSRTHRLACRARIEGLVQRAHRLVAARCSCQPGEPMRQCNKRVQASNKDYWKTAAELSNLLLGPVADQLGDRRILIAAEGMLQHLPWSSLPMPGEARVRDIPLLARHEVVLWHLPADGAYQPKQGRTRKDRPVIIFADPVFESDDPRLTRAGDARSSRNTERENTSPIGVDHAIRGVCRLPHTGYEADAIMRSVPPGRGTSLTDLEASRERVLDADLHQYGIIHFATHGSADPARAGLLLSTINEWGGKEEGLLSIADIFELELSADLVVLSACNTARAVDTGELGTASIAHAFMAAGAQRIVASLWSVDDAVTKELMKYFYENLLQKNMSAPAALRSAQMRLRQKAAWSAPYYWAPFILLER